MRKAISLFVALAMALSLVNISVFAADFSDTQGHWAEDAIDRWSEYGVVNGMGDGTFAPKGTMTREQAVKVAFAAVQALD